MITDGKRVKYIDKSESVPLGWHMGRPKGSVGPKGKVACIEIETGKIKFFTKDNIPDGWKLGRKL